MGRLLSLAFRNLLRNRRRSLLSAGAILVGVAMIVFLRGFANGFIERVTLNAVEGKIGALQIHRAGFLDATSEPLKLDMPLDEAFMRKLASIPGVTAVAPRITFDAMLGNGVTSTMTLVSAIDPVAEARVCPGRFSQGSDSASLAPNDESGAVVGKTLAEALGAAPGATLTLLTATRAGGSNAMDVAVRGLMGSISPLESKRSATISLRLAQSLAQMEGRATEYALSIAKVDEADVVADRVRAALGPDYEVKTWLELMPPAKELIQRLTVILGFISGVLFFLVLGGIANTMLMAVYERVREIGTMLAVGAKRRMVVRLFLAEAIALGLLGGLLGAVAGSLAVLWLNHTGVPLRPPGTTTTILVFPFVAPFYVLGSILVAAASALVAALYPAYRASKLTPVEALRAL